MKFSRLEILEPTLEDTYEIKHVFLDVEVTSTAFGITAVKDGKEMASIDRLFEPVIFGTYLALQGRPTLPVPSAQDESAFWYLYPDQRLDCLRSSHLDQDRELEERAQEVGKRFGVPADYSVVKAPDLDELIEAAARLGLILEPGK